MSKVSYKVGDEVRIRRTDGSTSIARIKETSVRYVKKGTSTVANKKLDESAIGTTVQDKEGNIYIASKVYTVVILDKDNDFAETKLTKTIADSDILGRELIVHYDPEMLAAFLETHQGPDYSAGQGSAAGQGSGSGIASDKGGNKRNKRSRNKRTKRTKRTKHNKRRR